MENNDYLDYQEFLKNNLEKLNENYLLDFNSSNLEFVELENKFNELNEQLSGYETRTKDFFDIEKKLDGKEREIRILDIKNKGLQSKLSFYKNKKGFFEKFIFKKRDYQVILGSEELEEFFERINFVGGKIKNVMPYVELTGITSPNDIGLYGMGGEQTHTSSSEVKFFVHYMSKNKINFKDFF